MKFLDSKIFFYKIFRNTKIVFVIFITLFLSNLFFYNNNYSRYNIFFVETNDKRLIYSTKQLCAIESSAKNNPYGNVYIYSIAAKFPSDKFFEIYPNIIMKEFEPNKFFNDTLLKNLWHEGELLKSPYYYAHLSDAFRMTILYKFGGF